MSRLTLRLPETLHRRLETLAKREQTSLNQYLIYALARQASEAYTVAELPTETIAQQQETFTTLLQNLGHASAAQVEQALAERESTTPERRLKPHLVRRVHKRLASHSRAITERKGKASRT